MSKPNVCTQCKETFSIPYARARNNDDIAVCSPKCARELNARRPTEPDGPDELVPTEERIDMMMRYAGWDPRDRPQNGEQVRILSTQSLQAMDAEIKAEADQVNLALNSSDGELTAAFLFQTVTTLDELEERGYVTYQDIESLHTSRASAYEDYKEQTERASAANSRAESAAHRELASVAATSWKLLNDFLTDLGEPRFPQDANDIESAAIEDLTKQH